jgi:hypothetical protein
MEMDQMSRGRQASIGDALIFMTKAALAVVVFVVAGWGYLVWKNNRTSRTEVALRNAAAAHALAEDRVVQVGEKLNECLANQERLIEGLRRAKQAAQASGSRSPGRLLTDEEFIGAGPPRNSRAAYGPGALVEVSATTLTGHPRDLADSYLGRRSTNGT